MLIRRFALRVADGFPYREDAEWVESTEELGVAINGHPGFWILNTIKGPLVPLPPATPPTYDELGELIDIGSGPDLTNFDLYAVPLPLGVIALPDAAAYLAAVADWEANLPILLGGESDS